MTMSDVLCLGGLVEVGLRVRARVQYLGLTDRVYDCGFRVQGVGVATQGVGVARSTVW